MRVAHVVRQYLPSLGGLEEVVRNLVQEQLQQGLQPYIITLDRVFKKADQTLPAEEIIEGVQVIRIPYFGSDRYPIAFSVLKHLKQADLVHVHAIDFFYDFLALTRLIHGKPLVVSTHGGFFHTGFASRLKKIYFHTITRLSSIAYKKVIGCSDNDGDIFSAIIKSKKLCVIENGVDIQKFNNAASETLQPVLIYFGRWSVNKGLYEAIDVIAALKSQDSTQPWRLIICGRAYDLSEADLKDYAKKQGVDERIHVLNNPTNQQISEQIGQASYYICLSKHEGFGIAPIEAMSAGLYPVLSAIPPFEKLVNQTNIGINIKTNNPFQLSEKVMQLHQSRMIDKKSIITSVTIYAWANVAQKYLREYHNAIGEK
ncbi:MAG: glycosyltransferase family 4 protein [Methylophilus sp.]|uniref:glycosyltransferase family 4 protein n=1 Tax=Methylophilus sp. TaxID=29541 RepID=UPI003FA0C551